MRRCLDCSLEFAGPDWACPRCGYKPTMVDGFPTFAPDLATEDRDFDYDAHHMLDKTQERSFWFRARNRLLAQLARQWFAAAKNVLEVGCGTGYVLAGLREVLPHARFAGSEASTLALRYAASRLGPDVRLLQMSATALPYSGEFDLIAACDVLEHLDDDETALREIHRALKPGGGVLLTVPQHPFLWSAADEFAHHKRRYRGLELAEKCRAAGLKTAVDTSFVVTLFPILAAKRLMRSRRAVYNLKSELVPPTFINHVLFAIMDIERRCIGLGVRFPFGSSRVVVALKDG
jgi:SAM-dependent methyltransferase